MRTEVLGENSCYMKTEVLGEKTCDEIVGWKQSSHIFFLLFFRPPVSPM